MATKNVQQNKEKVTEKSSTSVDLDIIMRGQEVLLKCKDQEKATKVWNFLKKFKLSRVSPHFPKIFHFFHSSTTAFLFFIYFFDYFLPFSISKKSQFFQISN
ncbi:hypothetical protein ACQ4LE_010281 [Meloidogyne hapla]